ncbi:MAG: SAM-dependent methyltransferase [Cyclobacterium sp.]|uniref:SAM-dependent methyltransferase n=1 Tax=Cyclobacterium sp. TaxID=1966343 RepID=UPI003970F05F
MAFELKNTVPWGRSLTEYKSMFNLTGPDLNKKIISFGDGPASFNYEMTQQNKTVTSLDPIYQFSKDELNRQIVSARDTVMKQMIENQNNFVWTSIKDLEELEHIRMRAMSDFIADFELGKNQHRYVHHELPETTSFKAQVFDLGLSSHFLILYSKLGIEFHIKSMAEMLRICKEIRIFPLLNLNAKKSEVLDGILEEFGNGYSCSIESVSYEFQKGGNKMLRIQNK